MRNALLSSSATMRFVAALLTSTSTAATNDPGLTVQLKHGSVREAQAERQLRRVIAKYDMAKWAQTDAIIIEEGAIPHSDPVLTLNTRHLKDDRLLISTYIHEQMHWWLSSHPQQTASAVSALKSMYKTLPVGFPDGADSLEGSYEHLLVICLELDGVRSVLGKAEEAHVLRHWMGDHYTGLYRIVKNDRAKIRMVLRKNDLLV